MTPPPINGEILPPSRRQAATQPTSAAGEPAKADLKPAGELWEAVGWKLADAAPYALTGQEIAPEAWLMDAADGYLALGRRTADQAKAFAQLEWVRFHSYWASGKGAGTKRKTRGWKAAWANWWGKAIERERAPQDRGAARRRAQAESLPDAFFN